MSRGAEFDSSTTWRRTVWWRGCFSSSGAPRSRAFGLGLFRPINVGALAPRVPPRSHQFICSHHSGETRPLSAPKLTDLYQKHSSKTCERVTTLKWTPWGSSTWGSSTLVRENVRARQRGALEQSVAESVSQSLGRHPPSNMNVYLLGLEDFKPRTLNPKP